MKKTVFVLIFLVSISVYAQLSQQQRDSIRAATGEDYKLMLAQLGSGTNTGVLWN